MCPTRSRVRIGSLLLVFAVLPGVLAAQANEQAAGQDPPRMHAGVSLALADPQKEFDTYVDVGAGIHGYFRVNVDPQGRVAFRANGGFLNYGNETRRVCLSPNLGCRIEVDLTTSNNIILFSVGPELGFHVGPSRLYGNASAGLSYFSTDSQVRGSSGNEPFASSRNYGDGGFAWTAGAGLEIPIARAGRFPVSLDFGVTYHGTGRREYLTRGGIIDRPDGSIDFDVKRSEADFVLWQLGVSFGIVPEP